MSQCLVYTRLNILVIQYVYINILLTETDISI